MVERSHIESTRDLLLEKSDSTSVPVLRDALRQARHSLDLIGCENIPEVIGGVVNSLPSLARELGKSAPRVEIADNGIMVRNQVSDLLRNVFMHLFRNSLDHGIESPEQRALAGKAAQGIIQLDVTLNADHLVLRLHDDGRGLAVHRIMDKARSKGLLLESQQLSPQQIAQLVFRPGFSTADQVTETSGRGVGMDAVKRFIEAEGGSIELVLASAEPHTEFCAFDTQIRLPAKFAVAPVLRLLQQLG